MRKIISYLYLLLLNFAYYILQFRFLEKRPQVSTYEEKRLNYTQSESISYLNKNPDLSAEKYVETLKEYDVISFDVFDTLIFRPVALPTDVFYFVGLKMDISNFTGIRTWAEWDARVKCNNRNGHMEIDLSDIWNNLAEDVGCSAEKGIDIEEKMELSLCYANPFMLSVWKQLIELNKEIIIVSDMYLPETIIRNMVEKAGFSGASRFYVSNSYGKNKASGTLFKMIKKEYQGKKIIHIGDNPHSDKDMAEQNGFDVMPYPNVNHNALLFRPFDMSYLVGSAYRGIVSNHLYNGLKSYSMEYEYGFIYGGLFALGYCSFIHDYCLKNNIERVLFLSRDGDILKHIYDSVFPEDNTEYVYWSRKAASKLTADEDKHDFFRRFIYHKVNQKYTIRKILHAMELDFLVDEMDDWHDIWIERLKKDIADSYHLAKIQLEKDLEDKNKRGYSGKKLKDYKVKRQELLNKNFSKEKLKETHEKNFIDLKPDDYLTDKNGYLLRRFIEAKWDIRRS